MDTFRTLLQQTLRNKHLLLFLTAVAFLSETHQTVTVFLNQIQYVKCGLSGSAIGYIYIAVTIAGLLSICSPAFTAKMGEKQGGLLLFAVSILSCLTLAFTGKAAWSIGAILFLRIGNSLFYPLQTELQNKQVHTAFRATALSINAMVIDSVGAGTNLIFGFFAERNVSFAFFFGAGISIVGLLIFFFCSFSR